MPEIDCALAYDFLTSEDPGMRYQLRFHPDTVTYGNPWASNPTGQLVAVAVEFGHPRNAHTIAISRPHHRLRPVRGNPYQLLNATFLALVVIPKAPSLSARSDPDWNCDIPSPYRRRA